MTEPGLGHRPAAVSLTAPDALSEASLASAIVETIVEPLLVLDGGHRVILANPAFCRHFKVEPTETLHRTVYSLGDGQWDIVPLRKLLGEVLSENSKISGFRVEHEFPSIGKRIMLLDANRIRRDSESDAILLAINDITECERVRLELEGERDFAEKLIDSVRESILVLGGICASITPIRIFTIVSWCRRKKPKAFLSGNSVTANGTVSTTSQ
ncbi:PAS domain-containing protein [Methylocystis sp.]|uniref:PAS domain-containing protein n=1 Tax=Methylocystis sp. TaxID=1911079 RepID=UPI003D0DF679